MTSIEQAAIDPDLQSFDIPVLRAKQPIGEIFLASLPFSRLIQISFFDVRRVIKEQRDVERYLGIQRPLDLSRVSKLTDYVNFYDASFPTAVIIAIDEDYAQYSEATGMLTVRNHKPDEKAPSIAISNLARVIDGQHRIAGLMEFQGTTFDVPVTIFVGADIADQAHVFSTVNLEQTKVTKNLVYDLYSLARSRSPQKTAHNVAVALGKDLSGPLGGRIKRLGAAFGDAGEFEPISQANFVESLLRLMSKDPRTDRDILLRGGVPPKYEGDEFWRYPFRSWFVDGQDMKIADALQAYFDAVRATWPVAWDDISRGGLVLNRSAGFKALMRLYLFLYRKQKLPNATVGRDSVLQYLKGLELRDEDFALANFVPGSSGESRLYRVLSGEEKL